MGEECALRQDPLDSESFVVAGHGGEFDAV
jgi:hypothetical protein